MFKSMIVAVMLFSGFLGSANLDVHRCKYQLVPESNHSENEELYSICPSEEEENQANNYLNTFLNRSYSSWKEWDQSWNDLQMKMDALIGKDPEGKWTEWLDQNFKSIEKQGEFIFTKFKDEYLKERGFLAEGGPLGSLYWVNFETLEKSFSISQMKRSRVLSYKIQETKDGSFIGQSPKIENAELILKNKDGFEFKRISVGRVKPYHVATGKFAISEEDYKKLWKVALEEKE